MFVGLKQVVLAAPCFNILERASAYEGTRRKEFERVNDRLPDVPGQYQNDACDVVQKILSGLLQMKLYLPRRMNLNVLYLARSLRRKHGKGMLPQVIESELDIVGAEHLSVVPMHAATEIECPVFSSRGRLPAFRQ